MDTSIENYHILIIKFVGQTNNLASRVKIISERFKQSITIPFNSDHGNDSCEIAEYWLKSNNFSIMGHAEGKGHYYVITNTFKALKAK